METPFSAYQGDEPYIIVCYAHDDAALVLDCHRTKRRLGWLYFEVLDGSRLLVGTDLVRNCDYRRLISYICFRKAEEQLQKRERAFGFTIVLIDVEPISVGLHACKA